MMGGEAVIDEVMVDWQVGFNSRLGEVVEGELRRVLCFDAVSSSEFSSVSSLIASCLSPVMGSMICIFALLSAVLLPAFQ